MPERATESTGTHHLQHNQRIPTRIMLTNDQREWVATQAPVTFALNPAQAKVLLLALDADIFSFQEIATEAGLTREGARLALRSFERRGLIRIRPYKILLPRGPLVAEAGEALLAMFDRFVSKSATRL
jgi:hypothetical protein